jgi:hypothetical protein
MDAGNWLPQLPRNNMDAIGIHLANAGKNSEMA